MTSGLAGRGPDAWSGSACRTWRWNPAPASRPRATVFWHLGGGEECRDAPLRAWRRRRPSRHHGQWLAHDSTIVPLPNAPSHIDRSFAPTPPLQS